MISNGFNDIMDLGLKLQDRVTPSNQLFKGEEPLEDGRLNSSGIFSKIQDNDYIQSELSRITFLHQNDPQGQETNLRNSKIKIDTFPADYDLEGKQNYPTNNLGAIISPIDDSRGFMTSYDAIYIYEILEDKSLDIELIYEGESFLKMWADSPRTGLH